jgi:PBP1b-binding outer membrane lipoprotein LpoB
MKKFFTILSIILLAFVLLSCDKVNSSDKSEDPNVLGGDPADIGQVGNKTSSSSVFVGGQSYDINSSMEVIKNDGGVATIKVTADLTNAPALQAFNDFIPASMKDASGKINTEVKLKMTTEGIADFFNKDNRQHTLVKYNGNVGDEYNLTKSDGVTIHRKVTTKSTTDDFAYYGGMGGYFKVMTIEQDSRVPGIKKFIYKTNHKYGLMYFEIVADDGSSAYVYF